jgi:hypothetical protein
MKVKFRNYIPHEEPSWVSVAYRYGKDRPWHIYETASYEISKECTIDELIKEVMEEMHVARKNVRIVRPEYVMFHEVK